MRSLGGVYAYLPHDLEAFPNHIRQVSRISARFPPVSRCNITAVTKNLTSTRGTRSVEIDQRIAYRQTEFLLFIQLAELRRHRLRISLAIKLQSSGEGVAGADRRAKVSMASGKISSNFEKRLVRCSWRRNKAGAPRGSGPARQIAEAGE